MTSRRKIPAKGVNVVKSWHLAHDEREISLTDFEYAMLRFMAAFNRFNEVGVATSSGYVLSASEIVLLNVIRMQDRPKSASVLANLLNRDDNSNIQYGLRKLRDLKLIKLRPGSNRKSYEYIVTEEGRTLTDRYAELKHQIITPMVNSIDEPSVRLGAATELVHLLTGIFDEGTRITATYRLADNGEFKTGH